MIVWHFILAVNKIVEDIIGEICFEFFVGTFFPILSYGSYLILFIILFNFISCIRIERTITKTVSNHNSFNMHLRAKLWKSTKTMYTKKYRLLSLNQFTQLNFILLVFECNTQKIGRCSAASAITNVNSIVGIFQTRCVQTDEYIEQRRSFCSVSEFDILRFPIQFSLFHTWS